MRSGPDILGFIFYKYLSERMHLFADDILKHDGIRFDPIGRDLTSPLNSGIHHHHVSVRCLIKLIIPISLARNR